MQLTAKQAQLVREGMNTPREAIHLVLDAIWLLTILLPLAYLATSWGKLPATVPTNFDMSGQPDAFGPRSSLMWLAIVLLITGVGMRFLHLLPLSFVNVPVQPTDANARAIGRLLAALLRGVAILTSSIMGFVVVATVRTALGHSSGMGPVTLIVALLLPLAFLVWMALAMHRAASAKR